MRRISILPWLSILCTAFTFSAAAQLPLNSSDVSKITPVFDAPAPNSLKCFIEKWRPFLDFALRFQAGYVVHCRLGVFEGKGATVLSYLRVTPEGKSPKLFGTGYRLPAITPDMASANAPGKLKQEVGMSGIFSVGEGNYAVDVLVMDDRSSFAKIFRSGLRIEHASVTLDPGSYSDFKSACASAEEKAAKN